MCAPSLREFLARLAVATDRMPWIQESIKLNENMKMNTGLFLPKMGGIICGAKWKTPLLNMPDVTVAV